MGSRLAMAGGIAASAGAAGTGGHGVAALSVCCESSRVAVGVTSSMRVASEESCPQVSGTLVAHNASDAIATLHARRVLLKGAMLEVAVLSCAQSLASAAAGGKGKRGRPQASTRPAS